MCCLSCRNLLGTKTIIRNPRRRPPKLTSWKKIRKPVYHYMSQIFVADVVMARQLSWKRSLSFCRSITLLGILICCSGRTWALLHFCMVISDWQSCGIFWWRSTLWLQCGKLPDVTNYFISSNDGNSSFWYFKYEKGRSPSCIYLFFTQLCKISFLCTKPFEGDTHWYSSVNTELYGAIFPVSLSQGARLAYNNEEVTSTKSHGVWGVYLLFII